MFRGQNLVPAVYTISMIYIYCTYNLSACLWLWRTFLHPIPFQPKAFVFGSISLGICQIEAYIVVCRWLSRQDQTSSLAIANLKLGWRPNLP